MSKLKFVNDSPTAIWGWIRFRLQKHLEKQFERARVAKAELTALKDLARAYLKDTTVYPKIIELLNLELSNLNVRINVLQDLQYDLDKIRFSHSSNYEEREPVSAGGEQEARIK